MTTANALFVLAIVAALCCHAGGTRITPDTDPENADDAQPPPWRMPDEADPHERTWMAFASSESIWGREMLARVRADLAAIANAIAPYEPVTMLVRPQDRPAAAALLDAGVDLVEARIDDLWIRDFGACFVVGRDGALGAVDLNFNGWGNKQAHANDAAVAGLMARRTGAEHIRAGITGEGGGIEVDGHGTAIITESCFANPNRNPGTTRGEIEADLKGRLGLRKIIWLPGIAGEDITDGHTDFYARFARPGLVIAAIDNDPESFDHAVTRRHIQILRAAADADGKPIEVIALPAPDSVRPAYDHDEFAAGYINFYVCNGAVIMPQFGDPTADAHAAETLGRVYPNRDIIQLDIDGIAAGGGGIHCATMQQPRAHDP